MRGRRMIQTLRLFLLLSPAKRTEYLKKKKVFASMGENCSIMDRKVPLYANLIRLGNNVHIAGKVDFVPHDIVHVMVNNSGLLQNTCNSKTLKERLGCIEIGDNVFIGSNTTILYDVRIGSNVVVGAGSLVNKDIPDNSVVCGVPAKVIGSIDGFIQKRINEKTYPEEFAVSGEAVNSCFAEWLWCEFYKKRQKGESF